MNTQKSIGNTNVATPRRRTNNGYGALATTGVVASWLWSKLMTLLGLAIVALVVWGLFFWTDSKATGAMRTELERRAFSEIATVDAPLYIQSHLFGDRGTYSAKAGNCRLTVSTPDGRPNVQIDSTDPNVASVAVEDADMTKLIATPQLRYCFE